LGKDERFMALYANDKGELIDHPNWGMLGRSGMEWIEPHESEMIPLPKGSTIVNVPNRLPVAIDRDQARLIKGFTSSQPFQAVAALLPQGFTRTFLPASVFPAKAQDIPLLGYTAVGFRAGEIWAAAVKTDEHWKWHPVNYNTSGLLKRIGKMLKKFPDNRIIRQLAKCSIEYGCFTAQNIFYGRWEAGIPTIAPCNAKCLGCISESHCDGKSPQQRIGFRPTVQEIIEVGVEHLTKAKEGIISFGQGCEGEPSLNADNLARAIIEIRQHSGQGTININSNAGYTKGIKLLSRAGLDAMRVTIFSCQEKNYWIYHQPLDYRLADVENSIIEAKSKGVQIALNLLTLPGFTDREDELQSLVDFIRRNKIDMVQLRNLNIDPETLFSQVPAGGNSLGIVNLMKSLHDEIPTLNIGSYTHPLR